jgi:predicted MFS family arabinose efflux permease
VLAFCTTLFGFSLNGFLPVIVQNIFHRGPETYTLLLVCSGAGSICGALIVAAMEKLKGKDRLTLLILISLGFITSGFALSRSLPLSCILIFLGGAAIMASASLMLSLAQLTVTDAMRGRVMSVYNLAFRAGVPFGALALGRIIPVVGISYALSGAGLMLVAVSGAFLLIRHATRVG